MKKDFEVGLKEVLENCLMMKKGETKALGYGEGLQTWTWGIVLRTEIISVSRELITPYSLISPLFLNYVNLLFTLGRETQSDTLTVGRMFYRKL
ncbi:hypothetical protein CRENBAI_007834 [Crenichthys baileyi]|uniref:Uncharacterized protein n=1 Tax=Crenichthys baileyi TaxID=28760 RepID=A0AAV9S1D2_9TELE